MKMSLLRHLCFFTICQSVALSRECQMGVDNLCKIFGPTLVGYSCPDPQPLQTVNETGTQQAVCFVSFFL